MEYNDIFIPVAEHLQMSGATKSHEQWGRRIKYGVKGFDWAWLRDFKVALVGLRKQGAPNSFVALREEFYALFAHGKSLPVIDLGDIEVATLSADDASSEKATYGIQKLISEGIFPIIFGENISGASNVYDAVKAHRKSVAATFILPSACMGNAQETLSDSNVLSHFMVDYGRELETLNVLAYQGYLTPPADIQRLSDCYCEFVRLGVVRENIKCAEPLLRDADVLCAGVNAIRQCDAPATIDPSPNGLLAEEMCQLLRLAAFSDKLKACYLGGFSEGAANDAQRQTAKVIAQLIWHITEGFAYRVNDDPTEPTTCRKLQIEMGGKEQQLVFYQSKITDRWWMAVPVDKSSTVHIIPCERNDYEKALRLEIPDRWLWFYKKFTR
jgi:formiminoglutamase